MNQSHPQTWSTLQLAALMAALMAAALSPFWFLAANLHDGDELAKTGVGAAIAGIVAAVLKRGTA